MRLHDLEAASTVADLAAGRPHPLHGDRAGQFALDLAGGMRLVFAPVQQANLTRLHGSADWARVNIVCIEYIGDYHA
jgi:proteic killer suppression protein